MKDDVKAMWQKILSHQLEGIMFHYEASGLYELVEIKCSARKHGKQYLQESITHYGTASKLIEEYGEIILPKFNPARVSLLANVTTRPAERGERAELASNITEHWREWEESTIKLYDEGLKLMPNCKLLQCLKKSVEKELKGIK